MSTIRVVAPANTMAVISQEMRSIGIRHLSDLGYNVDFSRNVDAVHFHTAGTVEQRLDDINDALDDPEVDIIMAVYGGYNSNQLLPYLDYERIRHRNKKFVGFSDITAIINAIYAQCGCITYHGPPFSAFCDPNLFVYTRDGFSNIMRGKRVVYESPDYTAHDKWWLKTGYGPREVLPFDGWKVHRTGRVTAPLVGGNLETLCALAGTQFFPTTAGHILLVEDTTGSAPGAFHRNLTQLRQMGVLTGLRGLLVGKAPTGTPLSEQERMIAILDDVLPAKSDFPVVYDVNCSHVDPIMTLPIGGRACLEATGEVSLTIEAE